MAYVKLNNDDTKFYQIDQYSRQIYKRIDNRIANDIMITISNHSLEEFSDLSATTITAVTVGADSQTLIDIQNIEGKVTQLSEQLVENSRLAIILRIEFDI